MKKILTIIGIGFLGLVLNVNAHTINDPEDPKQPKVANFSEVIGGINYPQHCASTGVQGIVKIRFSIDREGEMTSYEVVESPCNHLTSAVEEVIPELIFEPAQVEGQRVSSQIIVPINFQLTSPCSWCDVN